MSPRLIRNVVIVGVSLAVLVAFALRPTQLLGVDGGSLAYSVDSSLGLDSSPCHRKAGVWRCDVWDSDVSGTVNYFVKVNSTGCWSARRDPEADGGGTPKRQSGCVTLWDHFRPFDRFD